jgi:lipoprotein-anchoring transpeptidase ErfK/SrfK
MAVTSVEENAPARRRRPLLPIVAAGGVVLVLLLVLGLYLYDHSRRDVIASGVRVGGVAVGGLHAEAARQKLERELVAHLNEPVTVRSGTHSWTLQPRQAGVRVDVANMVAQAVSASREGSFLTRATRDLFGGSVNHDVPVVVSYSHQAVVNLTGEIRAAIDRAPRDASVEASASGLKAVPSAAGLKVETSVLRARVDRALVGLTPSRSVHVPARATQPAVTTANLAARYPAYIVIDRAGFRLHFYDHLKLTRTYEIAVGMEGLETPAGLHKIEWEQVNPPWYVPKKAWAGALAGTVVPPGPGDPLKARFMSFEGGAGIHGIDPSEYSSIGHDASHGCVRMRIPDVIDLYAKSPVGTPVYII